jgi:lipopolysaccharide/colanic/teichoic acid biosynthesis glycosyltransferase
MDTATLIAPKSRIPHHEIYQPRKLRQRRWRFCKRLTDLLCCLALVPILALPLLCIAFAIKIDSPGPVLFRQYRRGLHGDYFLCYKFRTMHAHLEDREARQQSRPGDPRITRIGRLLRRASLDELPQLFNVLRGDMSLVGPRPHAPGTSINDRLLPDVSEHYMLRYRVKPGITGLAQVHGLRGILDTEDKLHQRVTYDLRYITEWSFWMDIKILLKTFWCVFTHFRHIV